jgi:hypothetical protein
MLDGVCNFLQVELAYHVKSILGHEWLRSGEFVRRRGSYT